MLSLSQGQEIEFDGLGGAMAPAGPFREYVLSKGAPKDMFRGYVASCTKVFSRAQTCCRAVCGFLQGFRILPLGVTPSFGGPYRELLGGPRVHLGLAV